MKPFNLEKSLRLEHSKIIDITDTDSDSENEKPSNNKKAIIPTNKSKVSKNNKEQNKSLL